jgi:acetyl esterase
LSDRAYDPELAPMVPLLPTLSDWTDMPAARTAMVEMIAAAGGADAAPPEVRFEDRTIPGPEGAPPVAVRIYHPKQAATASRPGVLYIHGGGFCVGDIETEHAGAAGVALVADAVVVSVDYRLAPEHPFPAGLEDCHAALVWMVGEADALGLDPQHVGVMGQSAGGGLAAGLALLARDSGGPALCYQVLGIPELDDRLETASMHQFTDTPLWNRPNAEMSWRYYLGGSEGPVPDEVSPYAAPSRAEDLTGLPPAYVSTMEFDPLRDEGILYAMGLLEAGVSVELHQFPGTFHGSALVAQAEVSKRSGAELLAALRRGLRR